MIKQLKFYTAVPVLIVILILSPSFSEQETVKKDKVVLPDPLSVISEALVAENTALSSLKRRDLKTYSGFSEFNKSNFSFSVLDALPMPKMTSELKCLAEAIYFEARGESLIGQYAVGEVIINRMISPSFPNSICGVVSEGSSRLNACQFSYNCDGKLEIVTEKGSYGRISKLSQILLEPSARVLTDGATFYHAKAVNPSWAKKFKKTNEIGQHIFYKLE